MFSLIRINIKFPEKVGIFRRTMAKKAERWNILRGKKWPSDIALKHFDDFYPDVYGKSWPSIRLALLSMPKYCAVINNFSVHTDTRKNLEELGAYEISQRYKMQSERQKQMRIAWQKDKEEEKLEGFARNEISLESGSHSDSSNEPKKLEAMIESSIDHSEGLSELQSLNSEVLEDLEQFIRPTQMVNSDGELVDVTNDAEENIKSFLKPITHNLDSTSERLPSFGTSEFIPSNKLVGMEHWVNEDDYYRSYNPDSELPVKYEMDKCRSFPPLLNAYTFEKSIISRFPAPEVDHLGLLGYYLMDAASLLPVLALDVTPHDKILDMCAAPGGKSLAILQTMYPMQLVCNDNSPERIDRMYSVFDSYVPSFRSLKEKIKITNRNGQRWMETPEMFDKVLVDAPCTNDRHSLKVEHNNIFQPSRLKEKTELPSIQKNLLLTALHAVRPGGSVVYSTCSLSPIQNDGVVHNALQEIYQSGLMEVVVKDLAYLFRPLNFMIHLKGPMRYGHVVVPSLVANFGPMYICKLTRVK